MTSRQIFTYWPSSVKQTFLRWWNTQLERHYLICADVEAQRAKEHQVNSAYYQKKAIFIRANTR